MAVAVGLYFYFSAQPCGKGFLAPEGINPYNVPGLYLYHTGFKALRTVGHGVGCIASHGH